MSHERCRPSASTMQPSKPDMRLKLERTHRMPSESMAGKFSSPRHRSTTATAPRHCIAGCNLQPHSYMMACSQSRVVVIYHTTQSKGYPRCHYVTDTLSPHMSSFHFNGNLTPVSIGRCQCHRLSQTGRMGAPAGWIHCRRPLHHVNHRFITTQRASICQLMLLMRSIECAHMASDGLCRSEWTHLGCYL